MDKEDRQMVADIIDELGTQVNNLRVMKEEIKSINVRSQEEPFDDSNLKQEEDLAEAIHYLRNAIRTLENYI